MSTTQLNIKIVPGTEAPRDLGTYVELQQCYITEQGTNGRLPIVDFVGELPDGKKVFFSMTGRLVNAVAAAVRGVNMRIHGVEEP